MKINSNSILYNGNKINNQSMKETEVGKTQANGINIFAGNLNLQEDEISHKKKEAQQKAIKVVSDAYESDDEINDIIKKSQTLIDTYRSESDNAQKAADTIMDSVNTEVKGILLNEATDHIDEKLEDDQEEADKKTKETDEQKEQLDAVKKKRNSSDITDNKVDETITQAEQMLESNNATENLQMEVQKIIDQVNLTIEDIKGVIINMTL